MASPRIKFVKLKGVESAVEVFKKLQESTFPAIIERTVKAGHMESVMRMDRSLEIKHGKEVYLIQLDPRGLWLLIANNEFIENVE